jgi:hypothetical protein
MIFDACRCPKIGRLQALLFAQKSGMFSYKCCQKPKCPQSRAQLTHAGLTRCIISTWLFPTLQHKELLTMQKTTPHATADASMLRSQIELLMADRVHLLRVAGAAAKLVESTNIAKLPMSAIPLAEAVAASVNALSEDTLQEALQAVKQSKV